MAKITIYGPPQSTYVRTARMLCEEKGVAYDLQPVEFGSPAHLALHPFGKVPVCKCNGELLYETLAICSYLNDTLPGPSFIPTDARERARMNCWISLINAYAYTSMIRQLVLPRFGIVQVDESVANDAVAESVRQLGMANDELGANPYLAGESLSIADLLLVPIVDYLMAFPDMQEQLKDYTNLKRWYDELSARDSYSATVPPQG